MKTLTPKTAHAVVNRLLIDSIKDLDGAAGTVSETQVDDLLQGDRLAIILYLRVLTHGPIITYKLDCPSCKQKSEHEIDIQPVLDSIVPYPNWNAREFSIDLSGSAVFFNLPTGVTEKKISESSLRDVNARLAAMDIWEKHGEGKMMLQIDTMRSRDIATLRKSVRDLECEIDSTVQVNCECGETFARGILENHDFLFPNLT